MLNLIIILLILISIIYLFYVKENFTTLNDLNENTNIVNKFCKKLKIYDKPSEQTLMLKNFRDTKRKNNIELIKNLNKQINDYQKEKHFNDIDHINNYKCKLQKKTEKQLEVINKAKDNILNRNSLEFNIVN